MTLSPNLHLIGPLQSNKAKKAVAFFDMIQSLDRWELAEDLNRHAAAANKVQECLIEVKFRKSPRSQGWRPISCRNSWSVLPPCTICASADSWEFLRSPPQATPRAPTSGNCASLFETSRLEILSMGMSSDFEAAIEEGSTMVRLGTVLFWFPPAKSIHLNPCYN